MSLCRGFTICTLTILLFVNLSVQISTEEFLTLTLWQKIELDEFRDRVKYQVPNAYMTQDIYLIRWLRDQQFNVDDAEQRLLNHLSWRKENNMDTILDEDWSDFDQEYRGSVQGCNKFGHPILSVRIGELDIRRAVLTGKTQRMMRFIDRLFEEGLQMQRRMLKYGQNATQIVIILDNTNVNLIQHACPQCIAIYLYGLATLDLHYPGVTHKVFIVNTPQFVLPIWDLYKHLVPSQYMDILYIFGRDKTEWSRILLKEIEPDQLTKAYGGLNAEALDLHDLRETGKTYKCKHLK